MNLAAVTEIFETPDYKIANKYIAEGWKVLAHVDRGSDGKNQAYILVKLK